MTIKKKGFRRIVVDGVTYLWRFPRRPTNLEWDGNLAFTVIVQHVDRTGSVLSLSFGHRHPTVARVWGSPVISVTPSDVASGIRQALIEGWYPNEADSDYSLSVKSTRH